MEPDDERENNPLDSLDGDLEVIEVPIKSDPASKNDTVSRPQPTQNKKSSPEDKLWTKDFLIITLVNFLLFCGFQFFPSSLPLYVKDLGASDMVLGWITGITTIAAILIRPFSGVIVDRFGRKGIFLFSLLIMIGVSFSLAFFPVVGIILLIRFVHGIGWGLATTATSTIASDVIPRKRFGEGMGYFSLSASLAMAIAPGIGISLFHSMGMTSISYLATGVLVGAFVLALFVQSKPLAQPPDEDKKRHRLHEGIFEKNAIFPAIIVAFVTASYGSVVTFVAIFAEAQGVEGIGLFFTVYAVVLLIARPILGRIVDQRGARSVVLPGVIALALALALLSFADSLVFFLACAAILGFGFGASQSGLQTMAIGRAPAHRRGAANATFFIGFDVGLGIGSITSGLMVGLTGYAGMYLLYALLPLIAAAIFIVASRKSESSVKE